MWPISKYRDQFDIHFKMEGPKKKISLFTGLKSYYIIIIFLCIGNNSPLLIIVLYLTCIGWQGDEWRHIFQAWQGSFQDTYVVHYQIQES